MCDVLLRAGMLMYERRYWRPLERAAKQPEEAQQATLRKLLLANAQTSFGRKYGFADIRTVCQFHERVPVQDYEALRPLIDEQRYTGAPALTSQAPLFYAQTSGSTGAPKYIPITPALLATQRKEQALFSYLHYRARPAAFAGRSLGIMGAAEEGRLDSGHAVGSVSGQLYRSLPRLIQARFVVPPEVSAVADYEAKYRIIMCLALMEPNISYIGSPNPSTFLRLIDILNTNRDELLDALEIGRVPGVETLEPSTRRSVDRRMVARPEIAARLRRESTLTFANVWPSIRLVTTWTGGSCGVALATLRTLLPPSAAVMELGYQSTECRGTIAIDIESPSGIPPLTDYFFEFVEPAGWDNGRPRYLTLADLEPNRPYYIIVTTPGGLYRYFMNDLVEMTGQFECTPLLRFLQKGKGVTNLTGEKLYEAQVIDAIQYGLGLQHATAPFFLMIGDERRLSYDLLVELDLETNVDTASLAASVDQRLGELNIEYHAKRQSGRLATLTAQRLVRGTADAYKTACVRAGQREGQFKPTVLLYRKDLAMPMDGHVISAR
jgi:hypothetical protein